MQGVIKSYDPHTGLGSLLSEPERTEVFFGPEALAGSIFRFLRQGQRVNFDLDADGAATRIRFGSELDMSTPSEQPPGT